MREEGGEQKVEAEGDELERQEEEEEEEEEEEAEEEEEVVQEEEAGEEEENRKRRLSRVKGSRINKMLPHPASHNGCSLLVHIPHSCGVHSCMDTRNAGPVSMPLHPCRSSTCPLLTCAAAKAALCWCTSLSSTAGSSLRRRSSSCRGGVEGGQRWA